LPSATPSAGDVAAENLPCSLPGERVSSRPASDTLRQEHRALDFDSLSKKARTRLLFFGVGLLGLLGVARWLEPAASGFGTHQQLGLPECTTLTLFNVRCPSCGMTTSWSHFTRGQFAEATAANAGGLLLALSAGLCGIWAIASAIKGKHWVDRPTTIPALIWLAMIWLAIVIGVTVVQWIARL